MRKLKNGYQEIKIKKIVIPDAFSATLPRPDKFKEKYKYYRETGKFSERIILNQNKVLIDGYSTYLLVKMFGVEKIVVKVR